MRWDMKFLGACTALVCAAVPAMAFAEDEMEDPACPSGNIAIVRLSQLTKTGSMAGFEKAMADHAKWYADHGYAADKIFAAPVLKFDQAKNDLVQAPDQMMTFHTHASYVPSSAHDDAWNAYVAEYEANSEILNGTTICMPD